MVFSFQNSSSDQEFFWNRAEGRELQENIEKENWNIILFLEPALMGHVEPEQDYYYDSEDFNDEDDYAPTSKKSKVSSRHNATNLQFTNSHFFSLKNGDGDWKAAKSPKKPVRGGSSGKGRGRPKGSTNSKFFNKFLKKHSFTFFL